MKAPVFVLGCQRSGTTLLYDMLLSSGGFAVYRAETRVFDLLAPLFGAFGNARTKQELMEKWLQSRLFKRSGLHAETIRNKVLSECRNAGDFLRIVMESIAQTQNVDRWAENTPGHLLYIPEIKKTIPDALIIHIIRDGRDVALSLRELSWIRPFFWDKNQVLQVAGLHWEWIVKKGREHGREMEADYTEVRFEELIERPRETLARLGSFIGHDLDYARIQQVGIGAVNTPNTSFVADSSEATFNPVGRWKRKLSSEERVGFESLVGDFLRELGYPLGTPAHELYHTFKVKRMKIQYQWSFSLRLWLAKKNSLHRFLVKTDLLDDKL